MTSGLDKKLLIRFLIPIAICAVFWAVCPVNELISAELRNFLTIALWLILCVALDSFRSVFIPSFTAPVLWYVTGTLPITTAYMGWTMEILHVIIGAFFLAAILESTGVLKRIAYWIILRFGGSFKGTYWGLYIACTVIAFITFGNSYVVMAAITYGVVKAFNLGNSKGAALITISALMGTMTTRTFFYSPQTLGMVEAGAGTVIPGFSVSFYAFTLHMLPGVVLSILLVWVFGKMFGIDKVAVSMGKEYFQEEYNKLGPVRSEEIKSGAALFFLLAWLMTSPIHGLSANYGFLIIPLLLFLPGIDIGTSEAIKNINFEMLFFVVACLTIGVGGNALGLGAAVVAYLSPVVSSVGATGAALVTALFGVAVNFLLTPTAMLSALPASITSLALSLGVEPLSLLYPFIISTDLIFLPYEFIPYLIFFSFGTMSMKDFVKYSSVKVVLTLVFMMVIMMPWWKLLGVA